MSDQNSKVQGSSSSPEHLWENVESQRRQGVYPFTHLTHDHEGEIWLDPLRLPKDISRETIRRRDQSIPREWFHLPQGADPPTVEDLLKDSSSSEELDEDDDGLRRQEIIARRAKSPPICGRGTRSRSRDARSVKSPTKSPVALPKLPRGNAKELEEDQAERRGLDQKASVQSKEIKEPQASLATFQQATKQPESSHEPVSKTQQNVLSDQKEALPSSDDEVSGCFRRSRSRSKSKSKLSKRSESRQRSDDEADDVKRRREPKGSDELPRRKKKKTPPPPIDRKTKPEKPKRKSKIKEDDGGYEPVGLKKEDTDGGYEPVGQKRETLLASEKPRTTKENSHRSRTKSPDSLNPFLSESDDEFHRDPLTKLYEDLDGDEKDSVSGKDIEKEAKLEKDKAKKAMKEKIRLEQEELRKRFEAEKEAKKIEEVLKEQHAQKANKDRKKEQEQLRERMIREKEEKQREEKELKERSKAAKEEAKRKKEEAKKAAKQSKLEKQRLEQEEKQRRVEEAKLAKLEKQKQEKAEKQRKEEAAKLAKLDKMRQLEAERLRREQEKKEKSEKKMQVQEQKQEQEGEKWNTESTEERKALNEGAKIEDNTRELEIENESDAGQGELVEEGRIRKNSADEDSLARVTALEREIEKLKAEEEEFARYREKEENLTSPEKAEEEEEDAVHVDLSGHLSTNPPRAEGKETIEENAPLQKDEEKSFSGSFHELIDEEREVSHEQGQTSSDEPDEQNPFLNSSKENFFEDMEQESASDGDKAGLMSKVKGVFGKLVPGQEAPEGESVQEGATQHSKVKVRDKRAAKLKKQREAQDLAESKQAKVSASSEKLGKVEEPGDNEKVDKAETKRIKKEQEKLEKQKRDEEQQRLKEQVMKEKEAKKEKAKLEKEEKKREKLEREEKARREKEEMARLQKELREKAKQEKAKKEDDEKRAKETDQIDKGIGSAEVKHLSPKEVKRQEKDRKESQHDEGVEDRVKTKGSKSKRTFKLGFLNKANKSKSLSDLAKDEKGTFEEVEFHPDPTTKAQYDSKHPPSEHVYEEVGKKSQEPQIHEQTTSTLTPLKRSRSYDLMERFDDAESQTQEGSESKKKRRPRVPSPGELVQGFNTSLKKPLLTRSRQEDQETLNERKMLVSQFSPAELASMSGPSDFPLPKFRRNRSKSREKQTDNSQGRTRSPTPQRQQGTFSKSWQEKRIVTSMKENGDPEELKQRQELVRTKTPSELAQLSSISDFPVPSRVSTLLRPKKDEKKKQCKERTRSLSNASREADDKENTEKSSWLTARMVTNVKESDLNDQELRDRRELVSSTTPAQLATIKGISDIPVPSGLSNLFRKNRSRSNSVSKESKKRRRSTGSESLLRSTTESISRKPMGDMKLVTKVKVSDNPEETLKRKALIESKSPKELGKITSFSDIPLPSIKRGDTKKSETEERSTSPKRVNIEDMYSNLPRSLKSECLVRSKMEDQVKLKERQEIVKSNKPSELAQFHSVSDFPIPSALEKIFKTDEKHDKGFKEEEEIEERLKKNKPLFSYDTLPGTLRKECVVRRKENEDRDELKARQELVKTKTPAELSQMKTIEDFPLPTFRQSKRTLKSTKDKELQKRSKSWSSLPDTVSRMGTMPKSLTKEVLVRKKDEDPETAKERQAVIKGKSISDLAQISSIGDIPIPTPIENIILKRKKARSEAGSRSTSPLSSKSGKESVESPVPKSMKSEVLVRVRNEDPKVQRERQELTRAKSPGELAKMSSVSDIPVPFKKKSINDEKLASEPLPPPRHKEDPESKLSDTLKKEYLVRSKVDEDEEKIKQRIQLTREKSPSELGKISSWSDVPVPSLRKKKAKSNKDSDMEEVDRGKISPYDRIPDSLKTEVLVRSKVEEDPEVLAQRQALTREKSPEELGRIQGITDFPIPSLRRKKKSQTKTTEELENEHEETDAKENRFGKGPGYFKGEYLVRAKVDEDDEKMRDRVRLTRSKSPSELAQIKSVSDLPIPGYRSKSPEKAKRETTPKEKKSLYEQLPASLKTEVLVRSKAGSDQAELARRRDLTREKSPAELGEIRGFSDLPIPTFRKQRTQSPDSKQSEENNEPDTVKGKFATLPKSLMSECVVRSKIEDPEVQRERAEVVKSTSVHELSQISSFGDLPLPEFITRKPGPVERKKRFREKQRSHSARNIHDQLYGTLPKSMKAEVLVKSKVEDPEILKERRELLESKSVGELSQIHSFTDIPLPGTLRKFAGSKSNKDTMSEEDPASGRASRLSTRSLKDNMYASLPRSLTSQEVLVRSRQEDPDVLEERRALTQSKSVSELAKISSIGDIPLPGTIERFFGKKSKSRSRESSAVKDEPEYAVINKTSKSEADVKSERSGGSRPLSPQPRSEAMYASLPRGLKTELHVRSKVSDNEEEIKKRKELVAAKSPGELAQMHSFSEIPVPQLIEAWLRSSDKQEELSSSKRPSRSAHELREAGLFSSLPKSLKDATQEEKDSKNWPDNSSERSKLLSVSSGDGSSMVGQRHNAAFNTLPTSLKKPCVVRSKVEDPEILKARKELQQRKSVHELSKIDNLNEIPLPFRISLPDIPLPKAKKLIKAFSSQKKSSEQDKQRPRPKSDDYGYETIEPEEKLDTEGTVPKQSTVAAAEAENDNSGENILSCQNFSQYKGTPSMERRIPVRTKRRLKHEGRTSPPPPLPPKKYIGGHKDVTQTEEEEEDEEDSIEPMAVTGILTLESTDGNVHVRTDEVQKSTEENDDPNGKLDTNLPQEETTTPVPPPRGKEASKTLDRHPVCRIETDGSKRDERVDQSLASKDEPSEEKDEEETDPQKRIQSRPLPPPPAPKRTKKEKKKLQQQQQQFRQSSPEQNLSAPESVRSSMLSPQLSSSETSGAFQTAESRSPVMSSAADDSYHTVHSTLDRTLVASENLHHRRSGLMSDDDETLAESIIDSMHSCMDTFGETSVADQDTTIHGDEADDEGSNDGDKTDGDDHNAVFSDGTLSPEIPDLQHADDLPEEDIQGTEVHQRLSREILEDVENLRTTLDTVSHRLGKTE